MVGGEIVGSFIGSLFDGDGAGQAAKNALTDGAIAAGIGAVGKFAVAGVNSLRRSGKFAKILKNVCFVAGTAILMADGASKDIEDVQVGDRVATYDQQSRQTTVGTVSRVFVSDADGVYELTFEDGDKVEATAEHPFFVLDRGWVAAGSLQIGDGVLEPGGDSVRLESKEYRPGHRKVFNFEVDGTHTYFVGNGKLVHNKCLLGRRGGQAHRDTTAAVEADATLVHDTHVAGGSLKERLVKQVRRYPDIAYAEEGGAQVFYQIGRVGKRGNPVAREWDSGGDLAEIGEVFFVPYN